MKNPRHGQCIEPLIRCMQSCVPPRRVAWRLVLVFVVLLPFALGGLCLERLYGQDRVPNLGHPERIAAGEAVFVNSCALPACHGSGGKGGGAPVLRGRSWSPNRLWKIIHDASGATFMPTFGDKLSDDEIWAVIAYVMSLSSDPLTPSGTTALPGSENASPP